jgi:hypothetical protein
VPEDIQPAFWGDFRWILRHKRGLIGVKLACQSNHFRGCGHFQVQARGNGFTQSEYVAVLYVSAVSAQMDRDPVSSGKFGKNRGGDRIRFYRSPRLADCRNVVNIHTQLGHSTPFYNDELRMTNYELKSM